MSPAPASRKNVSGAVLAVSVMLSLGVTGRPQATQAAEAKGTLAPLPSETSASPDFSGSWLVMPGLLNTPDHQPIPFKPWAKAVYDQTNAMQDGGLPWLNNRVLCLPDGGTDVLFAPYVLQWIQTQKEVLFFLEENNQVRRIYMNRKQPAKIEPSYNGHSVGHWDGNVLVVETTGFNARAPLMTLTEGGAKRVNVTYTKALHVTERFHLANGGKQLIDEMTIDDPNAFTRPWTAIVTFNWRPDLRPNEWACSDSPLDLNG